MNVLPFIVIFQYFVFVNKKSFNCLQSYLEIPEHSRVTLFKNIQLKNIFDESDLIYKNYIFEITIFLRLISKKFLESQNINSSLSCTNIPSKNLSIFDLNIDFGKLLENKPRISNYPVIKYKPKIIVVYKNFLIEIKNKLANLRKLNYRLNKNIEKNSQNNSLENIEEKAEDFFNLSLLLTELKPELSEYSLNKSLDFSLNMETDILIDENESNDFCQINEFDNFFANNELSSKNIFTNLNINNKILIFIISTLTLIIFYLFYSYAKINNKLKNTICDLQKENFNLNHSLKKLKQYYEKTFNQEKINLNNSLRESIHNDLNSKNNELMELKKEFCSINKDLEKKKIEIEISNDKNKNLKIELKELEEEVEILRKKITVNIRRINNLTNENTKSKELLIEKENSIESLRNKNENLINEIKILKEEIDSKNDSLKKSIDFKTLNKLESDKNNLEHELEKKNQILNSSFQELENLKTKLKNLEEQNLILQTDLESKKKFSHRYLKEKEEEFELRERKLILEKEKLENDFNDIKINYYEKLLKENEKLIKELNLIENENQKLINKLNSSSNNNDLKLTPPELPKFFEENIHMLNNSSSSSNVYSFSNYNYPDTRSLANSSFSDNNRSSNEAYCFSKNKSLNNHSTNSQNNKNNTFS